MEITKIELKILIKEFLSASNRVLRADFEDYATELSKFVTYLDGTELISNYIKSCGEPECDIESSVNEVAGSYGRMIFGLGSTNEKEVANIYATIKYLADNNISGRSFVYCGYSSSKKFQEKVDAFGDRFIRVLITHIENYLTRISIQMGLDDKTTINIHLENSSFDNSQLNVATGQGTVNATQNNFDVKKLQTLIDNLKENSDGLLEDDCEIVNESIETIETLKTDKPKKGLIKTALKALQGISGSANFIAAVAEIITFVQDYI